MAPKKKNQGKNGFIYFAESIRTILLSEGHKINGIQDLVALAAPKWQALTPEEREPYKEEARANKAMQGMVPHRSCLPRPATRDCVGELLSEHVDATKVNERRRRREREEVVSQWPRGKRVREEKFFILSFEIMVLDPETHVIIPCEIAVVEYSIADGIIRTFHRFIKPGPLPLGYRYTATMNSNKTHKIPVEGMKNEDSYSDILNDLETFLSRGSSLIPPVYSRKQKCQEGALSLEWLAERAGFQNRIRRVYEVEGLIIDLEASLLNHSVPNFMASTSDVNELLSTSVFDYEINTRCEYHEEQDTKHCALGTVKRACYCMSDFLCPKADVEFTEKHLPVTEMFPAAESIVLPTSNPSKTPFKADPVHVPVYTPAADNRRFMEKDCSYRDSTQPINDNGYLNNKGYQGASLQSTQSSGRARGRDRGRGRGTLIAEPLRRPGEKIANVPLPTKRDQEMIAWVKNQHIKLDGNETPAN